jgi:sugar lactone lactonase YvrE
VDTNNWLYCSEGSLHRVIRRRINAPSDEFNIVAGASCSGSGAYGLSTPQGVFISTDGYLYVADSGNHRIQRFRLIESYGTTVAGAAAPGTITLSGPTSVILDADQYLFISDYHNHRVVGSGPFGFRCLVGCSGNWGTTAQNLFYPMGISFDRYGNLYVADHYNNRIQKFSLLSHSCSKFNMRLLSSFFRFLFD